MSTDSVDKQVANALRKYPDLHDNRDEILDHMFCCYGTGYEWDEEGHLTYDDDDAYISIEDALVEQSPAKQLEWHRKHMPEITEEDEKLFGMKRRLDEELLADAAKNFPRLEKVIRESDEIAKRHSIIPHDNYLVLEEDPKKAFWKNRHWYGMSKNSPLVEILNGVDTYGAIVKPHPDDLEAAYEVAIKILLTPYDPDNRYDKDGLVWLTNRAYAASFTSVFGSVLWDKLLHELGPERPQFFTLYNAALEQDKALRKTPAFENWKMP